MFRYLNYKIRQFNYLTLIFIVCPQNLIIKRNLRKNYVNMLIYLKSNINNLMRKRILSQIPIYI